MRASSKEDILREIRQLAEERGGRLGLRAFLTATGLPERAVIGKYWPSWGAAVAEAGIAAGEFNSARTADATVFHALARLAKKLGRWPSDPDLRLARPSDSDLPGEKLMRRLRASGTLREDLLDFCATKPEFAAVAEIVNSEPRLQPPSPADAHDGLRISRPAVAGHVYMMKSGRRYKIGHTNSVARRHREVRLDLPDPTVVVHAIATDDPSGIEKYWHRRFQEKRVAETEFFDLDAADVAAFKRRTYQ